MSQLTGSHVRTMVWETCIGCDLPGNYTQKRNETNVTSNRNKLDLVKPICPQYTSELNL